jgi:hypothetical protein
MVYQGTLIDRLEDWGRDGAGMLRRRIPIPTVLRVVVECVTVALLGAAALATGDAALLLVVGVPILVVETAVRLLR